jgi:epsin
MADRVSEGVLGKRARAAIASPDTPLKRARQRKTEGILDPSAASPEPRSGRLTPDASTLTESLVPLEATQTSQSSQSSDEPVSVFPFMKLPAELRLHVYHMALVRAHPINLHVERPVETPSETSADPTSIQLSSMAVLPRLAPTVSTEPTTPRLMRSTRPEPMKLADPILPAILRLNAQTHKEARQLLYAENTFVLSLASGVHTLATLHQRSRSLIKHAILSIPSHHDILDGFADLVRLGLRYCWGLKTFRIILEASLPDDGRISGATNVYANAFHILRWLPRGCQVVLEGCVSEAVRWVVCEEGRLMNLLDEVSFFDEGGWAGRRRLNLD